MLTKLIKSYSTNSLVNLYDLSLTNPVLKKNIELKEKYIIEPSFSWWDKKESKILYSIKAKKVDENFEYSSDKNTDWLNVQSIKKLLVN